MQYKLELCMFVAMFVLLVEPLSSWAQESRDAEKRKAADAPGSQGDVAKEIAEVRQAIGRLETKLDQLSEQPSEFSKVSVRIVDEENEPVKGFRVRLSSSDNQRATATGTSTDDGTALSRQLPYGSYQLSVSGNNWNTFEPVVTVEVGAPLELTIVAPSENKRGKLTLVSSVSAENIKNLPFGGWWIKSPSSEMAYHVPEPADTASPVWRTFPTVANGVEAVAVSVDLKVQRLIKQSDGRQRMWTWRPESAAEQEPQLKWLVRSDGKLQPILSATGKRKKIKRPDGLFSALAPKRGSPENASGSPARDEVVGFDELKLGEDFQGEATIEIPSGQIEILVDKIYGRPSQEALEALGRPDASSDGEIWLPAVVRTDSQWLVRILGESAFSRRVNRGYVKEVEVAAGETQTVAIGAETSEELSDP